MGRRPRSKSKPSDDKRGTDRARGRDAGLRGASSTGPASQAIGAPSVPVTIKHGWTLYGWTAFNEQLAELEAAVEALRAANPTGYQQHPKAKLALAIQRLIFDVIPQAPDHDRYRLGKTLGDAHTHWRRAKFNQRFRLFFRFNSRAKIIVYAWINDESTLRKAGARTDPYAVFAAMLAARRPPTDWDELLRVAQDLARRKRAGHP